MKYEPVKDYAERKRISALIDQCEKERTMRVETMSCQECRHYEVGKPCKPFLNELDCHYEPKDEPQTEGEGE